MGFRPSSVEIQHNMYGATKQNTTWGQSRKCERRQMLKILAVASCMAAFGRPSPRGGGRLRRPSPCRDSSCGPLVFPELASACIRRIGPISFFLSALSPYCIFVCLFDQFVALSDFLQELLFFVNCFYPAQFEHAFNCCFGKGCPQADFCPIRVRIGVPEKYILQNSSELRGKFNGTSRSV